MRKQSVYDFLFRISYVAGYQQAVRDMRESIDKLRPKDEEDSE